MLTLILYLMIFDNNSSNSNATTESNSSNLSITDAAASAVTNRANKLVLKNNNNCDSILNNSVTSDIDATLAGLAKLDISELSAFEKQLAKAAREAKKEEMLLSEQLSEEEGLIVVYLIN